MPAVNNTLQLNDRMTPVLRSIMKALDSTLVAMASVDNVARREFQAAQRAVQQANQSVVQFRNTLSSTSSDNSFANGMYRNTDAVSGLVDKIKELILAYGAWMGTQKLVHASDEYIGSTAQLNLMLKMNESQKTAAELQQQIYEASQRSLGNYREMSKTVGKLGILANEAFGGNTDQMIAFAELLNKQFSLAGATPWEKSAATYQLTQAMASGRLQGDEFRSIIENAPMLAQTIQEYMGLTGQAFKEASRNGEITADIIKNSLFSVAEETNRMFAEMPLKFSELWQQVINKIDKGLEPVYRRLRDVWNNKDTQTFLDNMTNGFVNFLNAGLAVFDTIAKVTSVIYEHWSIIGPLVYGLGTAFGLLALAVGTYSIVTGIASGTSAVYWAWLEMQTGTTFKATAAQYGLNAAMMANPIGLVILGIIALIALLYAMVGVINHVTGSSLSATGTISAMVMVAIAVIWNAFMALAEFLFGIISYVWNRFAMFANFLANVFQNPVSSIINLFSDMASNVLRIIGAIANAIDAVFGSDLGQAVSNWQSGLGSLTKKAVEKFAGDENYEKKVATLDKSFGEVTGWNRINYDTAALTGYDWGKEKAQDLEDVFTVGDKMYHADKVFGAGGTLGDIAKSGAGTNKNTADTANALKDGINLNDEDIELLKEFARISFVNRFTTMTPQVTASFGDVHETADVKGIIEQIKKSVNDALESSLT